jgi:hypothetical protein
VITAQTLAFILSAMACNVDADRQVRGIAEAAGGANSQACRCEKSSKIPNSDPVALAVSEYPDEAIGKDVTFPNAVRRLLQDSRWSREDKFRYLAQQSGRSEKRGARVFEFLAELDWPRFLSCVLERKKPLSAGEWIAVMDALDRHNSHRTPREYPPALMRRFFLLAQTFPRPGVRYGATANLIERGIPIEAALILANRLDRESGRSVRLAIYELLTYYDDLRTNRLLRDAIRAGVELKTIADLCEVSLPEGKLIARHRYDFLPDLAFLVEKLKKETDVRKKEATQELIEHLEKAIVNLENQKERRERIGGDPLPGMSEPLMDEPVSPPRDPASSAKMPASKSRSGP